MFLAVASAIRTSLGPKGMDKMVVIKFDILICLFYFDTCVCTVDCTSKKNGLNIFCV